MKISRTIVQKTVKRFREIGSAADRPERGRKRSARTEQNKTSFVRTIIRKDLRLNSYRIQKSPRTHGQNGVKQT
ncbi:hypothetical protein WR25_16294 [Diploscapter pachys]|uniref:Paired domain-containing protein n=1 Tax=Diploscapter pachys TaxID=2018661 RepID=A0A2A2KIS4_9BILA|nr:hypothetical protein WR25_16294 [Diploscapter pachys]